MKNTTTAPAAPAYNKNLDREFSFASYNQSAIYEIRNYEVVARSFGATEVEEALRNLRMAFWYALSRPEVQRFEAKLRRPILNWRASEFKDAKIKEVDVKAACEAAKRILSPYLCPREQGRRVWDYLLEELPAELKALTEEADRLAARAEEERKRNEENEAFRARWYSAPACHCPEPRSLWDRAWDEIKQERADYLERTMSTAERNKRDGW